MPSLPPRLPVLLAQALADQQPPAGGHWSDGEARCEGAKYHSPTPLVLWTHSLHPHDATNTDELALLCAVCIDNLKVYQQIQIYLGNDIPWPLRREFANGVRALADRGWKAAYGDAA